MLYRRAAPAARGGWFPPAADSGPCPADPDPASAHAFGDLGCLASPAFCLYLSLYYGRSHVLIVDLAGWDQTDYRPAKKYNNGSEDVTDLLVPHFEYLTKIRICVNFVVIKQILNSN